MKKGCYILWAGVLIGLLLPQSAPGGDRIEAAVFKTEAHRRGAPAGWEIVEQEGKAKLSLERVGGAYGLNLTSEGRGALGIARGLTVDIARYPYLTWRWQAVALPEQGDIRRAGSDDQALKIYLVFAPTGFPAGRNIPVIGYIWDNRAPKGWRGPGPRSPGTQTRYVVVRNGKDRRGRWYEETRNVYQDFQTLFAKEKGGQPPGTLRAIRIAIDTRNKGGFAQAYLGEAFFSKAGEGGGER